MLVQGPLRDVTTVKFVMNDEFVETVTWAFSRQGATGVPLFTTWDSVAGSGRAPIPENISGRKLTRVLNSVGSVLVHLRYVTKRPRTGEGCDPGNSGVWDRDYGWGVRVRRPFGARGMSSVRYGTRLGDLKNKQPTESLSSPASYLFKKISKDRSMANPGHCLTITS